MRVLRLLLLFIVLLLLPLLPLPCPATYDIDRATYRPAAFYLQRTTYYLLLWVKCITYVVHIVGNQPPAILHHRTAPLPCIIDQLHYYASSISSVTMLIDQRSASLPLVIHHRSAPLPSIAHQLRYHASSISVATTNSAVVIDGALFLVGLLALYYVVPRICVSRHST